MYKSKLTYIIYLLVLVCFAKIKAQKLPLEYNYSPQDHLLTRGGNNFAGFYDIESIDTIFLEFVQSNFWTLLTNNYESKTDIPATLKYKDKIYENVGVRFKGMTAYQMNTTEKKSFNISLDYMIDQDIDGYTTFNLNCGYEDPSRIREFLYLYYNRKHIPAAKANFVILVINGSSWGLYTNVQQLNKQHAREWFSDADATRWRAEGDSNGFGMPGGGGSNWGGPGGGEIDTTLGSLPGGGPGGGGPGGGGPGGGGFGAGNSTLNYLGDDTSTYQEYYTLKNAYKDDPWNDLVNACKILNTVDLSMLIDSLGNVMDIDGALWFIAQEILFTDDDSYVNKGGMDYYVYFDVGTNRLLPVEYDGNTTFVTNEASSWSPFYKEENIDFSLMNVLFKIPELRQRYLAHVRTILNESLNSENANKIIDTYVELIDNHVNNDPKKIYTYNDFTNEITRIKSFISNRNNYLANYSEVNVSSPVISEVAFSINNEKFLIPGDTDTVIVTASVSGENGISKVNLYFGTDIEGWFSKREMFDDGIHGDGLANDNNYGATIPAFEKSTFVRFYIEAIDTTSVGTRSYSPEGAEHYVYAYRVKTAESVNSDVVINELMPSNSYFTDQDGETEDWIELYNNGNISIDLTGYYLSDNDNKLSKWRFPDGTTIGSNEYLIVWADKDTLQEGLHTNFKLSSGGEEVLLITPEILITDHVIYSEQNSDLAYARMENGTGSFTWQQPTFNSENVKYASNIKGGAIIDKSEFIIYPNPASYYVNIEIKNFTGNEKLRLINIFGMVVFEIQFNGFLQIDVSSLSNGVYIVSLGTNTFKRLVINN